MSTEHLLRGGGIRYCLDKCPGARAARRASWTEYLRSECHEDAVKWRNKCGSMLRRIRRIRETMDRSINSADASERASLSPTRRDHRLQSAIEDYSIQTGLDYEQSRTVIDSTPPLGEKGGTEYASASYSPETALRRFLDSATPVKTVLPLDAAFAADEQLARSGMARLMVWALSRSLWLVVAALFLSFLVNQSWLAGIPLVLVTVIALPSFPFPPHSLWKQLFAFELLVIVAKLVWQLPIVCDVGGDTSIWWRLFRLSPDHCPPVYVASKAVRLGLYKAAQDQLLPSLVWTEMLVVVVILVHMRSLFLSGRSALTPRQARETVRSRPTWDTYTLRFLLSLTVTILLMTDWSSISATKLPVVSAPSLLGESFSRSHFSAWQVVAITGFVFQIVLDRCLYTLLSHSPTESQPDRQGWIRFVTLSSITAQFFLLLFAMNLRVMLPFFLTYSLYLVLSARQLAFDIRPVGGKSGWLWSPGRLPYYAYRAYLAIPFLDELRQLCDWVASPGTALSLFMWFKVEDCEQNLRFVQAEMDSRQQLPLSRGDRACIGLSAVVGLVAIITGPLVFFSGLNVLREQNPIVAAVPGEPPSSLMIYLTPNKSLPRIELYSSSQLEAEPLSSTAVASDELLAPLLVLQSADLQRVSFPPASDTDWTPSSPLRIALESALSGKGNVTITAEWTLVRQLSPFTTSLTSTTSVPAASVLAALKSPTGGVVPTPNLVPSVAYLDASSMSKVIEEKGAHGESQLELHVDAKGHQWWTLTDNGGVLCLGERTMGSSPGGSYFISVIGLYIGVVLTVGRFLRLSLQGSSKRIDVEELPATETLMQLCQGIHIARLFKDIDTEKHLYYDLVKLFRDPQLLLAATGATVSDNNL